MSRGWPYIEHGDAEAMVIDILSNNTPELPDSIPVRPDKKDFQEGMRWVSVSREGGSKGWPKIDRPRIDIECLGRSRAEALKMAQVCEASIFSWMGNYRAKGCFLSNVVEELAPTRVPDKYSGQARYIFSLRLTVTPDEASGSQPLT